MSNGSGLNNLSVALLLSDIDEIKEITNVFRKLGVIPYFYEDLKSFWQGTLERIPSLAIVDVKKMSEGNLVLKNHPNIMTEEMPLLFYYTDNTEPLLVSTQEIFHLGVVKKATSYESVFKGLLKRINKMIALEQENHHLRFTVQAKTDELNKLEDEINLAKKIDRYQNLSREVCQMIISSHQEHDLLNVLEKTIHNVAEFEHFAIVELSFNGQKLISPISHSNKYRAIPSIWLGQVCKVGIELFAQNMASQVAHDILGGNVVSLLIKGTNEKPEKMLFIKTSDELCFDHFDWSLLESFINGLNASICLRTKKEIVNSNKFNSTYEAMSFIDQFIFGTNIEEANNQNVSKVDYRLVNLDLSSIVDIILKNGNQRFYWKKFRDDFYARFELQTKCEFKYFENGVKDLIFLVNSSELDNFFDELKLFASKFSYWKYFENNEAILFQEIKPKVTMTAMSAYAYLKNRGTDNSANHITNEKQKNSKNIDIQWNRAFDNEV